MAKTRGEETKNLVRWTLGTRLFKAEPYLLSTWRSKVEIRNEILELLREVSKATQDPAVNRTVDTLLESLARQR